MKKYFNLQGQMVPVWQGSELYMDLRHKERYGRNHEKFEATPVHQSSRLPGFDMFAQFKLKSDPGPNSMKDPDFEGFFRQIEKMRDGMKYF